MEGRGSLQKMVNGKKSYSYEGEFLMGQFEGKGTLQYENGESYVGDFRNGKKHGQGVYNYSNGSVYKGKFEDDVKTDDCC